MATFYSCKNAVVRGNGNVWIANQWTVEESADEIDTSNFEAGGYSDAINGLLTARITIEFPFDGGNNPFDAGFMGLGLGTNLSLYLNGTAGPRFLFPTVLIHASTTPSDVKSNGKGTVRMRNKGSYSRPTGVISIIAA